VVEPLVIQRCRVDGTRIIRVAGELDMATAPQLAFVLARCDDKEVCVDLAEVTFLDSSGLAVLSRAHRRAAQREGEFTVQNAAPNVRKIFEVTNLTCLLGSEPE
jgi:anti-anti-sigma factor